MRRVIATASFTLASTLLLLAAHTSTASAKEYILVILDTTGSMAQTSLGGATRMQVAKDLIASELAGHNAPDNEYALWFFEGTTFTEILPFAAGNAAKSNVITTANGASPGGVTPLAHTVCAGVDELSSVGLPSDTRRIILASDGEENNTPSSPPDQCFGPSSVTLTTFPFDNNSWQNRVVKKLCTGDANSAGVGACDFSTNLAFVLDVFQIFNFTAVTGSASFAGASTNPEAAMASRSRSAAVALTTNLDQAFFSSIAQVTGGRYTGITPQTSPDTVYVAPGDANRDRCVTLLDRTQVIRDSGTPGNGFDDFNHNGIVDNSDLQTVLQNLGQCAPFISVDVQKAIPDNDIRGASSLVSVTSPVLRIQRVKVDVDITHTFRGNLLIQVVAPDGKAATLSNRAGGSADNYVVTNLDITSLFGTTSLVPGTWRLLVRDLASGDVGTINKFRVTVTTAI